MNRGCGRAIYVEEKKGGRCRTEFCIIADDADLPTGHGKSAGMIKESGTLGDWPHRVLLIQGEPGEAWYKRLGQSVLGSV